MSTPRVRVARREQPGHNAGENRNDRREGQDACVDLNLLKTRNTSRLKGDQCLQSAVRHGHANSAADDREEHVLDEQETHDAESTRPERSPERDLFAA
jgi:hypothetical protein